MHFLDYQKVNVLHDFILHNDAFDVHPHHSFFFTHKIISLLNSIYPESINSVKFNDIKFGKIQKGALHSPILRIPFEIFDEMGLLTVYYSKYNNNKHVVPDDLFIEPIKFSIRFSNIKPNSNFLPAFIHSEENTLDLKFDSEFNLDSYMLDYVLFDSNHPEKFDYVFHLKYKFDSQHNPISKHFFFRSLFSESITIDVSLINAFDAVEKTFQKLLPLAYLSSDVFFSTFTEFVEYTSITPDNILQFDEQLKASFVDDNDYYENNLSLIEMLTV